MEAYSVRIVSGEPPAVATLICRYIVLTLVLVSGVGGAASMMITIPADGDVHASESTVNAPPTAVAVNAAPTIAAGGTGDIGGSVNVACPAWPKEFIISMKYWRPLGLYVSPNRLIRSRDDAAEFQLSRSLELNAFQPADAVWKSALTSAWLGVTGLTGFAQFLAYAPALFLAKTVPAIFPLMAATPPPNLMSAILCIVSS